MGRLLTSPSLRHRVAAPLLLLFAVLVCYWPIVLGRQPAGGDVTAFFYPLMAHYDQSLRSGDWPPVWNDRWGYGFPGLADSHMGVFYPPHLLLFGVLPVEQAYGINLLLHMVLAAWFAYFAARTVGLQPAAAGLCGMIFFSGDFFTLHAPHQWAYTTGCWFPLAVLLTWRTLGLPNLASLAPRTAEYSPVEPSASPPADRRFGAALSPVLLAAVFAIQMLAGHFQLAFYTQLSCLLLAGASLLLTKTSWRLRIVRAASIPAAWGTSLLLASVQLLPTAELAQHALRNVDRFEYLSGFANTPLHLLNYLAGPLFHGSPLWRGIVWSPNTPGGPDPWHTAPEECLNYVGLVPLCLALGACWKWKKDAPVRLCALSLLVSVLLSFGPYLPFFRGLITLPGFAWFRSPARWGLATSFWLALLAGLAFQWLAAVELRRWLRNFAILWIAGIGILVAAMWGLAARQPEDQGFVATSLRTVWQHTSPWEQADVDDIRRQAHAPLDLGDEMLVARLTESGYALPDLQARRAELSVARQWPGMLAPELLPYAVIIALLIVFSFLRRLPAQPFKVLLLLLTVADLALLTTVRRLEWEPAGFLNHSALLDALKQSPENAGDPRIRPSHRTIDALRNLPLAAGASPVLAYRTLEIPAFADLPLVALSDVGFRDVPPQVEAIFRLSGIGTTARRATPPSHAQGATAIRRIRDPLMVRTFFTSAYAEQLAKHVPSLLEYHVIRWDDRPGQAWVIPERIETAKERFDAIPDPNEVQPARVRRPDAHHVVIDATVDGPALLVLADLYYPGWRAVLKNAQRHEPVKILRAFGAWRGVVLPRAGKYQVHMQFVSSPFRSGVVLSSAGWTCWLAVLVMILRWLRRGAGVVPSPLEAK